MESLRISYLIPMTKASSSGLSRMEIVATCEIPRKEESLHWTRRLLLLTENIGIEELTNENFFGDKEEKRSSNPSSYKKYTYSMN